MSELAHADRLASAGSHKRHFMDRPSATDLANRILRPDGLRISSRSGGPVLRMIGTPNEWPITAHVNAYLIVRDAAALWCDWASDAGLSRSEIADRTASMADRTASLLCGDGSPIYAGLIRATISR